MKQAKKLLTWTLCAALWMAPWVMVLAESESETKGETSSETVVETSEALSETEAETKAEAESAEKAAGGEAKPLSIAELNKGGQNEALVEVEAVVTALWSARQAAVLQMPKEQVKNETDRIAILLKKVDTASLKLGDLVKVKAKYVLQEEQNYLEFVALLDQKADQMDLVDIPIMGIPETKEAREAFMYRVFKPEGTYHVNGTDELISNGSLILCDGEKPLVQATQAGLPGSDEAKAQAEYNDQHRLILDDGNDDFFSLKFGQEGEAKPPQAFPYIDPETKSPQLSSEVTFEKPMIFSYIKGQAIIEPQETVLDGDAAKSGVHFSDVREEKPAELEGNFKLATFNVLNYFADLGINCDAKDKDGKPLCQPAMNLFDGKEAVSGNWDCPARGAWDETGLKRQEDKIVGAIQELGKAGASVIALQEIENGSQFGQDIDVALNQLVKALNEAEGSEVWAAVKAPAEMPKFGNEDKIRQTFIYKPEAINLVGESFYLDDEAYQSAADARAPIGQVFEDKATGKKILVINNHLTYKGGKPVGDDNQNPGDEKGPAFDVGRNNGDRERQAKALVAFAKAKAEELQADLSVLVGDFNSYSYESPIQVLKDEGYADLMNPLEHESQHSATDWPEFSYQYRGTFGSLDHVMLSKEAQTYFKDFDIWTANAYTPTAFEYSKYRASGTDYYANDVFRASDHSAVLVSFELK